jgi:hypothetical protein
MTSSRGPGVGAPVIVVVSRFVTRLSFLFSLCWRCELESALAASFCYTSVELTGKFGDSGCNVIVMSAPTMFYGHAWLTVCGRCGARVCGPKTLKTSHFQ